MERAVGEIFESEREKYKIEEDKTCAGWFLRKGESCLAYSEVLSETMGKCSCVSRKNKKV